MLRFPFYSQLRVPSGYANYACGPTVRAAGRLARWNAAKLGGHQPRGLIRAARSYGFTPRTGSGWTELARSLQSGHPVVAHVDTTPLRNRPYGYQGGHYVVITGLVRGADGRVTHVICNDPATSYASRGQGIRYSFADFERAWAAKNKWFVGLR